MPAATADAPSALAWQYDNRASVNRYRSPDGRFVSSQQVKQLRGDFLDARAATARDLAAQLASGDLSVSQWETAMRKQIKLTHGVEFAFGRGGLNMMTAADFDQVGQLVVKQFAYLNAFAGQISDGTLSEAMIGARSEMYIGSAVSAYERGAAAASGVVDLPTYPGDACLGGGRCRCSWDLNTLENGDTEAYWLTDIGPCSVCSGLGDEYSPLVIRANED